jgi:dolichol-phosphate mannosyltransferase
MNNDPSSRPASPCLGVVIPCFNEELVIPELLRRLDAFAARCPGPVRFLFIDDGSRDRTFSLLAEACAGDDRMGVLRFSRNFGHQTALTAGLRHIEGDLIAVLDADLQDPPEVVLTMLERWREGYDIVYGVREKRKESLFLRAAYALFYRTLKRVANIDLPLDSGDFCIMDRKVVDILNAMPEHNRFIRGLRGWVGFRQLGLPYEREARQAGETKYSLSKLLQLALDGLISFSVLPLRFAVLAGSISALLGFLYFLYAVAGKLFFNANPPGWTSLVVLLLFFGGIQLLVMGIIGEYVGRIFDEVKSRPHFLVAEKAGWVR